jgi:hypothetical protein
MDEELEEEVEKMKLLIYYTIYITFIYLYIHGILNIYFILFNIFT